MKIVNDRIAVVLINAVNAAGKSHFIRSVLEYKSLDSSQCYEMDSLKFWFPNNQLSDIEIEEFLESNLQGINDRKLERIKKNIFASSGKERLIKIQFIKLCKKNKPFISVNPKILRVGEGGVSFYIMLLDIFPVNIFQVAILPTIPRYIKNLIKRRKWERIIENVIEYRRIINNLDHYDLIVKNSTLGFFEKDISKVVNVLSK